jgi:hypothetical protein
MSLRYLSLVLLLGAILPVATGSAAVTSPLDGRWTASITRAQLLRAGASKSLALKLYGTYTARYGNGRFEFRNHRTGAIARGTFTVRGKVSRIVFATGVGVKPGEISECTWNIYRDRLTFKPIPGRPSLLCNAGVWGRAG